MAIQWYPGHMTKSMRMIEDNVKLIDVVLYVLDSRAPLSCINPNFAPIIARLPVIYLLNKSDLGDPSAVERARRVLTDDHSAAMAIDSTVSRSTAGLIALIRKMCAGKLDRYAARGVRTTIKAMVLGVPNTGKSTLINNLCGKAKAITGNRAGVTRGKQWVRVNEWLEVLDTPGTLYPKLTDQSVARRLAYLGSVKDEVVDSYELACDLVYDLAASGDAIAQRYGVTVTADREQTMHALAQSRGFVLKGGAADLERTASAVLDDFRKGRLGRITLDPIEEQS